jgi:hypothetical protein
MTDPFQHNLDAAYRRGYQAARREPWQDLKRRFLASLTGANAILFLALAACLIFPLLAYLISLFS